MSTLGRAVKARGYRVSCKAPDVFESICIARLVEMVVAKAGYIRKMIPSSSEPQNFQLAEFLQLCWPRRFCG
tara:strand:- start:118 stop:333 length:216 start_codon:yes stop_codon:yes gene_type:complete